MSAETLRRAAALMRERAEEAKPGPWSVRMTSSTYVVTNGARGLVAMNSARRGLASLEHIASWHPAVALAVADWLDEMARLYEHGDNGGPLIWRHALAVARTYLGEPS